MARTVVIGGGVWAGWLAIGDDWRGADVPAPDRAGLLASVRA